MTLSRLLMAIFATLAFGLSLATASEIQTQAVQFPEGPEWSGILPEDGEYKLRVYLMRSAARRNEIANFTLTVSLSNDSKQNLGEAPASDAKVAGTPYHAIGHVRCIQNDSREAECAFGVIRGKPGNADVHITQPDGGLRILRFVGKTVSAAGNEVKATKQDDQWSVEVNGERYRIPEAVIVGG